VPAVAQAVVRSHHERWDGTGYPDAKPARALHQFARIAAVADAFDAITSERPYARAAPVHVALRALQAGKGTAYDPEVVDWFLRLVGPYPPGIEVILSDRRRGVVAGVSGPRLDRPRVRVGWDEKGKRVEPYELDLAQEPRLALAPIDGANAAARTAA
jgi:HD-GYP domain-containing protein (c-di-GMP phosphodiesterase class II)